MSDFVKKANLPSFSDFSHLPVRVEENKCDAESGYFFSEGSWFQLVPVEAHDGVDIELDMLPTANSCKMEIPIATSILKALWRLV